MKEAKSIELESHTKYEQARIIGARALQISMGAPFLVKLKEGELAKMGYNPIEIAKKEYALGIIPISVKQPKPKTRYNPNATQEEALISPIVSVSKKSGKEDKDDDSGED